MDTARISALCVIALMVVGCSTASRMKELVLPTNEVTIVNSHDMDVRVKVIGGDEQTASSGSFLSVLVRSLNTTIVFLPSFVPLIVKHYASERAAKETIINGVENLSQLSL